MRRKMWGGRFAKKTHPGFEYFSSSLEDDWRLAPYDLKASRVHAKMLRRVGILSPLAAARIDRSLQAIEKALNRSRKNFRNRRFEDIHSYIESELIRKVGEDAKRIHAARSRNDQVNQATRMYLKDMIARLDALTLRLEKAIHAKAEAYSTVVLPGMTHLKKAQPVLAAHLFLSYLEPLERSREALGDVLKRVDILTLGSGALVGTSIPIDRKWVQRALGFSRLSRNSIDAVGSRDFVAEYLFHLALMGTHFSRMAEDLLIGQMEGLGIYVIPENLLTGSSMMPQKKNPDFLELVRGASSVLVGNATAILTLLKGLPTSYNRDLQWDKSILFQSTELVVQILDLFRVFFEGLSIDRERARLALQDDALLATDMAEKLVLNGWPFRKAHERIGQLLRYCEGERCSLKEAPQKLLRSLFEGDERHVLSCIDVGKSVFSKKSYGGTSPSRVREQLRFWRKKLRDRV